MVVLLGYQTVRCLMTFRAQFETGRELCLSNHAASRRTLVEKHLKSHKPYFFRRTRRSSSAHNKTKVIQTSAEHASPPDAVSWWRSQGEVGHVPRGITADLVSHSSLSTRVDVTLPACRSAQSTLLGTITVRHSWSYVDGRGFQFRVQGLRLKGNGIITHSILPSAAAFCLLQDWTTPSCQGHQNPSGGPVERQAE
ncbi:hypothetical protein LIA77_02314 [Sarocladium implicatum]|jgi:hypothetical protein|nr:hypothetical protein LIA77_02314 [Sarocladium implicatum]